MGLSQQVSGGGPVGASKVSPELSQQESRQHHEDACGDVDKSIVPNASGIIHEVSSVAA